MPTTTPERGSAPEILLLHGRSPAPLLAIREILATAGLEAATATELPDLEMNQGDKVAHYIQHCRLVLVLLTCDEALPPPGRASENVYHELGLCQSYKPKSTIVLRERRGTGEVEIPSNVKDQFTIIPFESPALDDIVGRLLSALSSHDLLFSEPATRVKRSSSRRGDLDTLRRFMDQMDCLWEKELDLAWTALARETDAEVNFGLILDRFFVEYQLAFAAYVRLKRRRARLERTCTLHLANATAQAASAWILAIDSRITLLDRSAKVDDHTKREIQRAYRAGLTLSNPADRLACFHRLVSTIDAALGDVP